MISEAADRTSFEVGLLSAVLYFTTVRFRGVGQFDRAKHKDQLAAEHCALGRVGRYMVYAVCFHNSVEHTVHVANVLDGKLERFYEPNGTKTPAKVKTKAPFKPPRPGV